MSNELYSPSGSPVNGTVGDAAVIQAEFELIETAFDKLPTMSGNGDLPVFTNTAGTALETVAAATALTKLGVTSTAAELSKTDDSAAAVSGFVSGMRMYINEGGLASTSVALMALTPESSFESFGPTGSSATNIWTAMDSIPANARIVIISPEILAVRDSGSAGLVSSTIYARATGNGTAVGNQTKCSAITGYGTAEDSLNYTMPEIFVPLDSSRRFDATWAMTGDVEISSAITLRVKGFVV